MRLPKKQQIALMETIFPLVLQKGRSTEDTSNRGVHLFIRSASCEPHTADVEYAGQRFPSLEVFEEKSRGNQKRRRKKGSTEVKRQNHIPFEIAARVQERSRERELPVRHACDIVSSWQAQISQFRV